MLLGFAQSPETAGNGGRGRGIPRSPSMEAMRAVSSPQTKALLSYSIIQDTCKKCGLCAKNCPTKCIPGNREEGYKIDSEKCIKCGTCFTKCPFKSISKG